MRGFVGLLAVLVLSAFSRELTACTITMPYPPPVRVDTAEWILAGVVTGYSGPFNSSGVTNEFWALEVSVKATARRTSRAKVIEIARFDLASDCSTSGVSLIQLETSYPIGSTVVAVAWPAEFAPRGDRPQLAASWARGMLQTVSVAPKQAITREAPYRDLRCLDQQTAYDLGYGSTTDILGIFEYHKELARLERASKRERRQILERLLWSRSIPYQKLALEYMGNSPESRELVDRARANGLR